jgi:hypothetical protein
MTSAYRLNVLRDWGERSIDHVLWCLHETSEHATASDASGSLQGRNLPTLGASAQALNGFAFMVRRHWSSHQNPISSFIR